MDIFFTLLLLATKSAKIESLNFVFYNYVINIETRVNIYANIYKKSMLSRFK